MKITQGNVMIEETKSIAEIMQILAALMEEKPNEWLPVYAALGGAIAGALGAFFPSYLIERYKSTKGSDRLLSSLLAEVQALLSIIEYRGYRDSIKEIITFLNTQEKGTTYKLTVLVPEHYCRIYQENAGNIGIIPYEYAHRIIIFYQLIDAIVQDVKAGGVFSNGATIEAYQETDKIFSRAIEIGHELIKSARYNYKLDKLLPEHL